MNKEENGQINHGIIFQGYLYKIIIINQDLFIVFFFTSFLFIYFFFIGWRKKRLDK